MKLKVVPMSSIIYEGISAQPKFAWLPTKVYPTWSNLNYYYWIWLESYFKTGINYLKAIQ